MTICEVEDSVQASRCIREEQCDECFMIDHRKECNGCEYYEHKPRAFSYAQLEFISREEKKCSKSGCDDNGHKHD